MARKRKPADILVSREGSLVLFLGNTQAGRDWLADSLFTPAMVGDAYAAEFRYALEIRDGAFAAGLTIADA